MRTWAKSSTPVALLAVGVLSLGGGTAFADTDGRGSIGGGNQLNLPISLPIDISGNAVGVLGDSTASSRGGAAVVDSGRGGSGGGAGGNTTNGENSILGGNQVVAPITAPINACGNAIAIFGDATAGCKGGASVKNSGGSGAGGNRTSGRSSILGGNQVVAPITAPINLCGNSVGVLGEAFSGCTGGASVSGGGKGGKGGGKGYRGRGRGHWSGGGAGGNITSGEHGILGGNQIVAPITAPINVCGNAVGNGRAGCAGGTSVKNSGGSGAGGNITSGRSSILGGNQVVAPITAPINLCGNSVGVLGDSFSGCTGGASVSGGGRGNGAGHNVTSGAQSILGGNQIVAPITAPINACGNAVAVLGDAKAGCKGGASVTGATGGGRNVTSGAQSILGGNQIVAPITAPINLCGNAVAVLGDAAAGCLGGASVGGQYHGRTNWHGIWNKKSRKGAHKVHTSGMLSALPMVPGVPDSGLLPTAAASPARPAAGKGGAAGALAPVTGLVGSLPVANSLGGATDVLPLGNLGLMSAEQPVGVTGMNPGSLIALALGALFAASATMFAVVRRLRPRGQR
ncbi:chaplin family protein [Microtetraspora malaysiensis]|uniref:Chaplin family protein n=1 Tax=Microtetraspora malaysiensis TaxID=161358 RepID=A0ABW6T4Q2_9ACTN